MIMVSRRKYIEYCVIAFMMVGVLICIGTLILSYKVNLLRSLTRIIGIYGLITIIICIILYFIIMIIINKGLLNYLEKRKLLSVIENNLIVIGAYKRKDNKKYLILPKIKITQNKQIIIDLCDLRVRALIDRYLNSFSTALPEQYIVEDYYISRNQNKLFIDYEDITKYKPENYLLYEYKEIVSKMDILQLYFDRKHIVDVRDFPHFLISGMSGSGKSYFVNELVIQTIIKGWEVVVLDLKRSYGLFKKHIRYLYEVDDILNELLAIEKEMKNRMETLQSELDKNPRALAIDIGFKPKLIVIEEYISLQSSLDKKKKEELDRVVKNLSVLARQCNIHLMLVMQSAGTENINSTTRSNLTKVLLGHAQSNILNATFGHGVDIPDIKGKLKKGEGLIKLDKISVLRVPSIEDMDSFYTIGVTAEGK